MAITERDLAAALLAAIHGMHPIYGSTSGWHGGIGGQMSTRGCSFIDPPHGNSEMQDNLRRILREWIEDNGGQGLDDEATRIMFEKEADRG